MRTLLLLGLVALATAAEFVVTPTVVGEFPHYYENCVGSCHALMALRADWREQMKKAHDELGFKMVRFHGLFDDDMSVLLSVTENGTLQLSLYNVFSVFDFLRSIDMRPIVELSFMPEALASGKDTIFHYKGNITPPKSYAQWNDFIRQFMQGLIAPFDGPSPVILSLNCGFFTGTQAQYFELLENTVRTIKGVDTRIPVGGPATCQTAWIAETVAYAQQHNFPLDFVSTHEYPTDVEPVRRDIMKQVVLKARAQAGGLPVFYTGP
ncbi:putative glycoside hydrolase family protein [Paratrimastix pyriformis]|uniref:Glycoside hydrolase family protein n=1 Tax=Paratrimastix pyriformis TaxID=342808 RepID=A0ABQ8UDK5_9EUKA|nr:putative glycoside hydrolase family protein [Paratrimastix pyriformis]